MAGTRKTRVTWIGSIALLSLLVATLAVARDYFDWGVGRAVGESDPANTAQPTPSSAAPTGSPSSGRPEKSKPPPGPESTPTVAPPVTTPPAPSIYNAFRISVDDGWGYDLDIERGKNEYQNSSWEWPTGRDYRDLYRTSKTAENNQIQGVAVNGSANPVRLVDRSATPETCRSPGQPNGGNVSLTTATTGDKICVRTHDGRWAMLTIVTVPATRDALLVVDVVVLA